MPAPDLKLRVFLCHASRDKPIVRELCQRLAENDWVDPWLDEKKLLPGEDWRTSIEEVVESSDLVIIFLSNNSVNKEGFIQKELRYAREISLEKPEGSIFLIPVRLEECIVPRGLRFIQWTDYFGEHKEKNYGSLIETFYNKYRLMIKLAGGQVLDISESLQNDPQHIRNVLVDYYEQLDGFASNPDPNALYVVPTGFLDLDKMTIGLQPPNLYIIASRSGKSKTSFLLSVARNSALTYKKIIAVFSSLGLSNINMIQYLISQETGIDYQRLITGKLTENEWPLFTHAIEVMGDAHIFFDDTPALTFKQLKDKCRRLVLEYELDLIMVDNLQFISSEEETVSSTKNPNYSTLKILARELNVPVLAGVQLTRGGERRSDKRPILSDLHEFSFLEDMADVIMFIYHPDEYEVDITAANVAEIIIAKHNYGQLGTIQLLFRSNLARFENAAVRSPWKDSTQDE